MIPYTVIFFIMSFLKHKIRFEINFLKYMTPTSRNSHIACDSSCKFIKKICKKKLFSAIFSKIFNWQIIPSWIIISYKIIKFASIFYKIYCEKCFIQNDSKGV